MEPEKLVLIALVNFGISILSGIGGAGGAAINTPLLIFLGLSPQQAIASGKINGLGISLGSVKGLVSAKVHRWRVIVPIMGLATAIGLIAPHIITNLDNQLYEKIIGWVLLAMVPLVLVRRSGLKERHTTRQQKTLGYIALALNFLLLAVLSSGVGMLIVVILMELLGMRALEANVTKRFSSLILNLVTALGLLSSGLIVWPVAGVLFATGSTAGYIGSKIAIQKGNRFVNYIFAFLLLLAAVELIM